MSVHGKTLEKDLLIKHHLQILYDQLLESNLLKIIQVPTSTENVPFVVGISGEFPNEDELEPLYYSEPFCFCQTSYILPYFLTVCPRNAGAIFKTLRVPHPLFSEPTPVLGPLEALSCFATRVSLTDEYFRTLSLLIAAAV